MLAGRNREGEERSDLIKEKLYEGLHIEPKDAYEEFAWNYDPELWVELTKQEWLNYDRVLIQTGGRDEVGVTAGKLLRPTLELMATIPLRYAKNSLLTNALLEISCPYISGYEVDPLITLISMNREAAITIFERASLYSGSPFKTKYDSEKEKNPWENEHIEQLENLLLEDTVDQSLSVSIAVILGQFSIFSRRIIELLLLALDSQVDRLRGYAYLELTRLQKVASRIGGETIMMLAEQYFISENRLKNRQAILGTMGTIIFNDEEFISYLMDEVKKGNKQAIFILENISFATPEIIDLLINNIMSLLSLGIPSILNTFGQILKASKYSNSLLKKDIRRIKMIHKMILEKKVDCNRKQVIENLGFMCNSRDLSFAFKILNKYPEFHFEVCILLARILEKMPSHKREIWMTKLYEYSLRPDPIGDSSRAVIARLALLNILKGDSTNNNLEISVIAKEMLAIY